MTASELQRIATRLGNSGWCRHWLHFNSPQTPVLMAIQVCDWTPDSKGRIPVPVREMEKHGFKLHFSLNPERLFIYTIERTDEDGTPYVPKLI